MLIKFCVILIIFINSNEINSKKLSGRIINGNNARRGQFPWYVFLTITNVRDSSICGGSIISSTWILTASHCLEFGTQSVEVKFGNIYENEMHSEMAKDFITHPYYNTRTIDRDIALVELQNEIEFDDNVSPIALPRSSMYDEYLIGKVLKICGFGAHERGHYSGPPERLKYARVRIFHIHQCRKFGIGIGIKTILCGREKKSYQNVCIGDSGGGLVLKYHRKYYVVGVVSFGLQQCDNPTIYQSVYQNLDWISSITGIMIEN